MPGLTGTPVLVFGLPESRHFALCEVFNEPLIEVFMS